MAGTLRFLNLLRRAVWRTVFVHGGLGTARAAAYSSILTLFPALLLVASLLATFQKTHAFITGISSAVGWALPPGAADTAMKYFENPQARPGRHLVAAIFLTLPAAAGVFSSWMDGFRRAYGIPNEWGWAKNTAVAFLLVLLASIPMCFATLLVAFGNQIESWLALHLVEFAVPFIFMVFMVLRWALAFGTAVAVLALVYHFGIPRFQPWHKVLPGALMATSLWFPATMTFGWYVTRFASYNAIYGPLGAAIALLVWLYIVSVIVLIGAEVNSLIFPRRVKVTSG